MLKFIATFLLLTSSLWAAPFPPPPGESPPPARGLERAVFSGGCFWGVEGVFEHVRGVTTVYSGYTGGSPSTAEYETVSTGTTGHAESVEITSDPRVISYGTLLKVFFSVAHDPTEWNYQGPDQGTQYRSAIWYLNEAQKRTALDYIAKLDAAGVFPSKIVTQVEPLRGFYKAEEYHQKFMEKNSTYPYIVAWDRPKLERLADMWPELVVKK